jgi:hypothetical protein
VMPLHTMLGPQLTPLLPDQSLVVVLGWQI